MTGMIVSQLVEVQPLPCEKGKSRRMQGCPKKLSGATQEGITAELRANAESEGSASQIDHLNASEPS